MAQVAMRPRLRTWTKGNIFLLAFATLMLACTPWLAVNFTGSAPRGLWRKTALPSVVTRGMWVTMAPPPSMLLWAPWWIPLLKPVAAVAGERVCVEAETLWILGRNYGRVYTQANGQPLPHLQEGCYVVAEGQVFLASQAAKSLDSRYFGPVAIADLMAEAFPVWTWR